MSDKLIEQIRSGSFGFADDFDIKPEVQEESVEEILFGDQQEQEVAAIQLLVFGVGTQAYAVPLEFVETVLNYGLVTPYPATAPDLLGGFQYRNEVLPLVDLHSLLGEEGEPVRKKIIILQIESRRIGFAVAALRRAQLVPYGQLSPVDDDATPQARNLFDAVATIDEGSVMVLSPQALVHQQLVITGNADETG